MWGVLAAVAGASVVLAAIETLATSGKAGPREEEKPRGLPPPGKDGPRSIDGRFVAKMWQATNAKDVLDKARKLGRK